jgi:ABC-type phosphate transport system substrate-binding protein
MKTTMMRAVMGALLLVGLTAVAGAADFVVIVNSGSSQGMLTKGEVKNLFLGKRTTLDNGAKAELAMLGAGKGHEAFCNEVIGKTPAQFGTFWKTALFTGTGTPPKLMVSDAEMIRFVKSNPNAIGYVSGAASVGDVKVLDIK